MAEKSQTTNDINMKESGIVFEKLKIMKEFSNIVNSVSNEEFLEIVPKAKFRKVKWTTMFNCFKQTLHDNMVKELNAMWESENIPEKLEILEKQREKFSDQNMNASVWRPQLGDVQAQLRAWDVENLQKQKQLLQCKAEDYEAKINRLKKIISAKRGYLKALHMDVEKYQKKNEEFILKINEKFESHSDMVKTLTPDSYVDLNLDDEGDECEWLVDNTKEV